MVSSYWTRFRNGNISGLVGGSVEDSVPPGHRFTIYFPRDIKEDGEEKQKILDQCTSMNNVTKNILVGINARQVALANELRLKYYIEGTLETPLATGLGNPHPVENGFTFSHPHGVPYIPGSSVKGIIRRAAEELALFDGKSGWTIPLVWILFGFDATSSYLDSIDNKGAGDDDGIADVWSKSYHNKIQEFATSKYLHSWIKLIAEQLPSSIDFDPVEESPKFLSALQQKKNETFRRSIHWQGVLKFWDSFPKKNVRMMVEIMNPHHGKYYRGEDDAPHDAESPVPIYFLAISPGTKFGFHVELGRQLEQLDIEQDKVNELLEEAFLHSFENIGFGAKTSVGYGTIKNKAKKSGNDGPDEADAIEVWDNALLLRKNNRIEAVSEKNRKAISSPQRSQEIIGGMDEHEKKRLSKGKLKAKVTIEIQGNKMEIKRIQIKDPN